MPLTIPRKSPVTSIPHQHGAGFILGPLLQQPTHNKLAPLSETSPPRDSSVLGFEGGKTPAARSQTGRALLSPTRNPQNRSVSARATADPSSFDVNYNNNGVSQFSSAAINNVPEAAVAQTGLIKPGMF